MPNRKLNKTARFQSPGQQKHKCMHLKPTENTWAVRELLGAAAPTLRLFQPRAHFSTACHLVFRTVRKSWRESVGLKPFWSQILLSKSPMLSTSWVPGSSERGGAAAKVRPAWGSEQRPSGG